MSMFRSFRTLICLLALLAMGTGCGSDSSEDTAVVVDETVNEESAVISEVQEIVEIEEQSQTPATQTALVMTPAKLEAWEIRLVEYRIDRNEAYSDPEQTPLMEKDLEGFEGLNYYLPEQKLHFHVQFEADAKPDTIDLVKRKGNVVQNLRKGSVKFIFDEEVHSLTVFGPVDTTEYGDYLWLPFYDATSGTETYPGGRYLDLDLSEDGTVELDFNFAYNPLCDYNHEKYNCTLPPAENRLPFKVEAGEMLFHPAE